MSLSFLKLLNRRHVLLGAFFCLVLIGLDGCRSRTGTTQWKKVVRSRSGPIEKIIFFNRGKNLVSAGSNGGIVIWDVSAETEGRTLRHEGRLVDIAFCAAKDVLASGGNNGHVKLWDTQTYTIIQDLESGTGRIHSLAASQDGKFLAVGGENGLTVWQAKGKDFSRIFEFHELALYSLAFSPSGKILAGASLHEVKIWDLALGQAKEVAKYRAECLAFGPSDCMLVLGKTDGSIELLDIPQSKVVLSLNFSDSPRCIAIDPTGKLLACGGQAYPNELITIWDLNTKQELITYGESEGTVTCLAFSPDGKMLASGSSNDTIKFWDVSPFPK